jgi:hypothetical protein
MFQPARWCAAEKIAAALSNIAEIAPATLR